MIVPNPTVEVHNCPGCGSPDGVAMGWPGNELSVAVGSRIFVQPPYRAMRCRECGLIYKSAILAPQALHDYYAAVDFRRWETPGLFPTERCVVKHLLRLPARSTILDVGCSSGRLLSRLTSDYRCFGVEINKAAATEAKGKGIVMLDPHGWSDEDPRLRFDAIVLMDVLEHLTAPVSVLTSAAIRLAPGGRLVICTGNADAPALRDDLANCWYFRNVEHLIMLTRRFADYLAGKLQLRLGVYEAVSHYDSGLGQRVGQWYRSVAFDALYRGRHPWLAPLVRVLPGGRKACAWVERPHRNVTRDHVVVIFEKLSLRT